jgi:hypothetical protein
MLVVRRHLVKRFTVLLLFLTACAPVTRMAATQSGYSVRHQETRGTWLKYKSDEELALIGKRYHYFPGDMRFTIRGEELTIVGGYVAIQHDGIAVQLLVRNKNGAHGEAWMNGFHSYKNMDIKPTDLDGK